MCYYLPMVLQSCFLLVFCETQQGILASMTASVAIHFD